jgi:protocatechuate 3,4-dioxygenase beta subunit
VKLAIIAFCLILVPAACAKQANPPEQVSKPSIQGRVLQEPDGSPIRKANVQLNGLPEPGLQGRGVAQYSAISDAEGEFTIAEIEPGRYFIVVEHPGFVQSGTGNRRTSITVQAGSGKNDLILHLQPAAIITGKIVDLDGDVMRDVSVMATLVGSSAGGRAVHSFGNAATNDLGEFRISELRAGRYKVTASPPQGSRPPDSKENSGKEQPIYLPTHYPGVLNEEQAVAVEIHAGAETRVNFGLLTGRAYLVSGSVTGIPNKSGMAQVILQGMGGGVSQPGEQELRDGGKFEFKNVLPGTYVARLIVFTFDGGKPAVQMLRLGQPIEVRNASVEGLLLQPEAGGQVRGKFRLDTEQKFDWTQLSVMLMLADGGGAEFEVGGTNGLPTSSNVSADGSFELKNVPGGTYQLVVGASSNNLADYFTKSIHLGGRDVTDSGFAVNAETYLDVVVSAKGASISGKVVDDKGQAIANATVVDIPSAEHRGRLDLYQRSTSDASGNFTLRGLSAGKYSVLAFEDLQEDVRQPDFLKSYGTHGAMVELEEGTRKSVVLKVIPNDAETQ